MLQIEKVDHVGIRVADKARSIAFYRRLGFALVSDAGFEDGHPVILRHAASGVTVNLLGPATAGDAGNVLMDIETKHPGYTHMALRVTSMAETRAFLEDQGIPITGSFRFGSLSAVFIRDLDRNVIELDALDGGGAQDSASDYRDHP